MKNLKLTVPVIKSFLAILDSGKGPTLVNDEGVEYSYVTKLKQSIIDRGGIDEISIGLSYIEYLMFSEALKRLGEKMVETSIGMLIELYAD